jgi:PTH1 family peptidyl-tRNA hydrolase
MKLVVGLGNPGAKYDRTRHNVGFAALDLLADRRGASWEAAPRGVEALVARWRAGGVVFAKPLTFMNLSGAAIVGLLQFYKIGVPDLLVVVDDVQLETGRLRLRGDGSAGGHNGLKSVIASLGTAQFSRLRIGVGRGDERRDLADHVLARFESDERGIIEDAVGRAADAVDAFIGDGIEAAMNRFNRKPDDGKTEEEQAPQEQDGKREDGKSEDN